MKETKNHCAECGRLLVSDEVALYRRLICRTAERDFLCKTCLAAYFRCTEALLDDKIRQYREAGCLLFQEKENDGY